MKTRIIQYPDSEMQDAIAELRRAEEMFSNAKTPLRIDEAGYRIEAARKRIAAIAQERGELFAERVAAESLRA